MLTQSLSFSMLEKKDVFIYNIYYYSVFQPVATVNPKCSFATEQNIRGLKAIFSPEHLYSLQ